jgi:hypothetical protein
MVSGLAKSGYPQATGRIGAQGLVTQLSRMGWVPHRRRDMYGVGNEIEVDPIRAFDGKMETR